MRRRRIGKWRIHAIMAILNNNYDAVMIFSFLVSGLLLACKCMQNGKIYELLMKPYESVPIMKLLPLVIILLMLSMCLLNSGFSYVGVIEIPLLICIIGFICSVSICAPIFYSVNSLLSFKAVLKLIIISFGLCSIQLLALKAFRTTVGIKKGVLTKEDFSEVGIRYYIRGILLILMFLGTYIASEWIG